jgi:hypothetical protein
MARAKLTLDKAGIRQDANDLSWPVVRRVTRRVLTRSAVLCPVDNGTLRASGRVKLKEGPKGPTGTVEYPINYAAAVHDGTRPHVIKARRRQALKFQMGGRTVFARSVRHPGTEGRPFLADAGAEVARGEGFQFRRVRG